MYEKWLKEGLKKPGKSAVGLAAALTKALKLETRMTRQTVYKMTWGTRKIFSNELAAIAAYIEEPVPNMPVQGSLENLQTLRVEKEIAAGVWREQDELNSHDAETIVVPSDFEHPSAEHFAFRMKGECMISSGILNGDTLICIAPVEKITDGKQVVIQRTRSGLIEVSPRVVKIYKDRTEYLCDGHRPVIVHTTGMKKRREEGETVKVVAIIRRMTRILK